MIFFKAKTMTLGRCSAGMQEWLVEEIMQWLAEKTLTDIRHVDGVISFHKSRPVFRSWIRLNPMQSIGYGEIHFLPQDDGVQIIAKLRPTLLYKIGLFWIPLLIVLFLLVWSSDGKLLGMRVFLSLPIFIIMCALSYLGNGPDDLLRRQVLRFIFQNKNGQQ